MKVSKKMLMEERDRNIKLMQETDPNTEEYEKYMNNISSINSIFENDKKLKNDRILKYTVDISAVVIPPLVSSIWIGIGYLIESDKYISSATLKNLVSRFKF
jgi:hypothetical protein